MRTAFPFTSRPTKSAAVPALTHTRSNSTPPGGVDGASSAGRAVFRTKGVPPLANEIANDFAIHCGGRSKRLRWTSWSPNLLKYPSTQSCVSACPWNPTLRPRTACRGPCPSGDGGRLAQDGILSPSISAYAAVLREEALVEGVLAHAFGRFEQRIAERVGRRGRAARRLRSNSRHHQQAGGEDHDQSGLLIRRFGSAGREHGVILLRQVERTSGPISSSAPKLGRRRL